MFRIFIAVAAAVAATSVAAETPVTVKVNDADKIVCKREVETGSLVAKHKVCRSRAEWDREMLRTRESIGAQSCNGREAGQPC